MDWLLLGGLGMIWAAALFPFRHRRASARASIEEFERKMDLLAGTERASGRWIIAPRKGERFLGDRERARSRARDRRRRVLIVLLESIGLTFLIGLFPPLRGMWIACGVFVLLLGVYCWLLIEARRSTPERPSRIIPTAPAPRPRTAANGYARPQSVRTVAYSPEVAASRPMSPGRVITDEDDLVHVVVRPAGELVIARA